MYQFMDDPANLLMNLRILDLKFEVLTQRKTFLTVIIGDCNAKFI